MDFFLLNVSKDFSYLGPDLDLDLNLGILLSCVFLMKVGADGRDGWESIHCLGM
jgi:hypothetical protein